MSGTVADPSGAVLPGVSVTATNNATGVVTTVVSNESGAYNLTGLLPGAYTVSAELPGFQKATYTNVVLGNAQQVRLNFTMQVATAAQSVEVTVAADTLLATSSSSIGEVLSQQKVADLPIVANNLVSFYLLMPGVRMNDDGISGTFAGLTADKVNIQRDGVDASGSARYSQAGAQTATVINPDLVGEMRIIVAPVDAEMGRGNGQIQFLTRSGTNQIRGAGVWSVRNSALDANTWTNNFAVNPATGAWKPTAPSFNNAHQLTWSVGGPIIKNRTFFFTLFDDQIVGAHTTQNPIVLTPCARNGIFRYFDSWNNGNAIAPTVSTGATPTIAVVDGIGNPLAPATNPTGGAFTGALRYASVFGKLPAALPAASADCSNIAALVQPGTNWDPFRKALDPTGYVTKLTATMPMPNNYTVGDGLNTAGFTWLRNENRGTESVFGTPSVGITAGGLARKQINTKIDHNLNPRNKLSVSYTYEDSAGNFDYATWPNGFQATVFKHPQTLSANFVSTLSPTLVNEARLGMRRIGENSYDPLNDPTLSKNALAFVPNVSGYPVLPLLGTGAVNFQTNQIVGSGGTSSYLDTTVLFSYGDSLSWTKGKHAFKFGGEIRRGRSLGNDAGVGNPTTIPRATGGDAANAPISTTAISSANMTGLAGTSASGNNAAVRNLLDFLAGSLSQVSQLKFMEDPNNLTSFVDFKTYPWRVREFHNNEASFYAKDDWKVQKNLTLNLGLRWDYYGVPYDTHGLMAGAIGGEAAIWGVSGSSFADWMKPGVRGTNTPVGYLGKNSPNPNTPWYNNDYNNFGPAVGFAWQVPWFGEGKTTIRGGYQVTYQIIQAPNNIFQENAVPGSTNSIQFTGDAAANAYLDLTKLSSLIPVPSSLVPMQPVPVTDRTQQVYQPQANTVAPYAQNLTLSVTRSLSSSLTLDLRYVGTLARKQWNPTFNINSPNFLFNGLKEAFDAARAGGESTLLNQIFNNINLGSGTVGQNGFTGAAELRADSRFNSNLANGNYSAVAATLNTLDYTAALNPTLPAVASGVNGAVLRVNQFPDNFIATNPQFSNVYLVTNDFSTNYHSLEAQVTMRPAHGLGFQSTYTFSRALGTGQWAASGNTLGPTFTAPFARHADYSVQPDTRTHDFRTNGTFSLPVGPNKQFFNGTSGVLGRIIENWQTGFVLNLNTGAPATVGASTSLYANARPDVVGPFPKEGKVTFNGTPKTTGSYFAPGTVATVKDPQCAALAASLQPLCTLNALANTQTGQVLIQNAKPGTVPSLGINSMYGPGRWRFDANISKAIRLTESKNLQFRLDASDVFNHPEPNAPSLSLASTTGFGVITGKSTLHRMLQAQLRFTF
ncbi:MAG TPA: TonB-dependent receptor [Terriglobia bacterium]